MVVWEITSLVHGTNTDGYFDLAHLLSNYNKPDETSQSGPPTKTRL